MSRPAAARYAHPRKAATASVETHHEGTVDADILDLGFEAEIWYWRGPSPFHFITVPEGPSTALHAMSPVVTYGWGMIPVTVRIGGTIWTTSLFPKDGRYLVPIKDAVRAAEQLSVGDTVRIELSVRG